jgi:hypothetical protein
MAKKGRNQRQMGDIGEFRPTKIPIAPKRAGLSGAAQGRVSKKRAEASKASALRPLGV